MRVPTHIFKLVYNESSGKAWAHWQANASGVRAGPPITYSQLSQHMEWSYCLVFLCVGLAIGGLKCTATSAPRLGVFT